MKLINCFTEFVIEYESEKEFTHHRMNFTLDGYTVAGVNKKSANQILVTYQKNESEGRE